MKMNCNVSFPTLKIYATEISHELNQSVVTALGNYSQIVAQKFNNLQGTDNPVIPYTPLTGIDLPILLSPAEGKSNGCVILVGESPLRKKKWENLIISTPFAIGFEPNLVKQCRRYKKIIQNIIDEGYSVYVTDIIKIWDVNKAGKLPISQFDIDFLGKEIQALNPLGVICWGKKAQRSMEKILGTNSNLKIVGIPHPSAMNTACWKRNYPNDCDGTENSVVEKASEIILTHIRNNP